MNLVKFFELFETEVNSYQETDKHSISDYYKFIRKDSLYYWRKMYLLQRLIYIQESIIDTNKTIQVWDVGCGYGTSSIFLSLNGIKSIGSTLEWYHKYIPERKKFWNAYGNTDLFTVKVENIYETFYPEESFDYILVQDTLHHLEPIDQALELFKKVLKKNGKIVVIEENGGNLVQRVKLYLRRGNNKIIEFYDENSQKKVLAGNENIRPLKVWKKLFYSHGLELFNVQYIRFLPPFLINENNYQRLIENEQKIWKNLPFLKNYFYWGLNFSAAKK